MTMIQSPHPFDNLYRSTRQLHTRFGTAQTVSAAIAIAEEEWREVQIEANRLKAAGVETQIKGHNLALETADLIVTLIGICDLCGVSYRNLMMAMAAVADKNDAKIPGETHEINPTTRKIERVKKGQL